MAELLAYLSYFVFSTASSIQRRHISLWRDTDKGQVDFAFRIAVYCFVGSLGLILFKPFEFNQPVSTLAFLTAVCGIFGAGAISLQYISQRHVEAGVTTLVGNVYTPITIALSSMLLHEGLKQQQILGTLLLFISVILVTRKHRLSRWRFDKYFWMVLTSGVLLGFCLTAERSLIKENGITTGTILSWGADLVCLFIAAVFVGQKSQYNFKQTTITGVLRFLLQISWVVLIFVVANLSLAASITTFKIVLVFITGAIFLHERDDLKRKIFGSLIATIGLLLLI